MQLTKHENQYFSDETVYVSGHAYIGCTFERCTLIVTNTPSHVERCSFVSCNWHLNYEVLWGDRRSKETLEQILRLINSTQETPQA